MHILVTGSSGMVGGVVVSALLSTGHRVSYPSSGELNLLHNREVLQKIKKISPDFIIHCAGRVGGIQENIQNQDVFLIENATMGFNLFQAAHALGIKNAFNLSSSCIYPKENNGLLQESDLMTGPLEPTNEGYALAKISVLKLCQYINSKYNCNYKTLIPCNLYGPGDKFSTQKAHLLPAVIKKTYDAIKNNEPCIEIWGSGTARREFMYVEDLADFILFGIDNFENIPELMNIGMGIDYSINEYYEAVAKHLGFKGKFKHDLSKPEGMKRKQVSVEKQNELGWKPKTSLASGIDKTYKFFMETQHLGKQ